jgi:hypothetical protein
LVTERKRAEEASAGVELLRLADKALSINQNKRAGDSRVLSLHGVLIDIDD